MESIKIDIGNELSMYYCALMNAIIEKKDFHRDDTDILQFQSQFFNQSRKNINFIKFLPTDIPFSELKPYSDKLLNAGIHESQICMSWFHRFDDIKAKYIAVPILKPLIQKLFDEALQRSQLDPSIIQLNHPVIHFRCSDTPFVRNEEYKLQRYEYFVSCLQKSGYLSGPVTILWYGGHMSDSKQSETCGHYANQLKETLQGYGYEVDIQSHSNVEDFAKIFYAPIAISTGGSFSMFAGLFGHGEFYQPQVYIPPVGVSADWLQSGYNLDHVDVADYHDVAEVSKMLIK